jgi:hypothetical protein
MQVGRPEKAPNGAISDAQAAKLLNVGEASVERAKVVLREGTFALVDMVEGGNLKAARLSSLIFAAIASSRAWSGSGPSLTGSGTLLEAVSHSLIRCWRTPSCSAICSCVQPHAASARARAMG